jgi:hypothetical protein
VPRWVTNIVLPSNPAVQAQLVQKGNDLWGICFFCYCQHVRLSRIRQAIASGMVDERTEGEEVIDRAQVVGKGAGIEVGEEPLEFPGEAHVVDIGRICGLGGGFQQRSGLGDWRIAIGQRPERVPPHAAGHISEVTARLGVVADVGQPACRQVLAKACIVVTKITIDLCGLAVYNRIIRWQVPMPGVVLNIPSAAGG